MGKRAGEPATSRRLLRAVLPVAIVVTLAGCGPDRAAPGTGAASGAGLAAPPSGGNPADALAKWRSFPVTAHPRPLVLTGGAVLVPATGFHTGEQKMAFLAADLELVTRAPAAPAFSAGYPVISARAALGRLRAAGKSQPATQPLRIIEVSLVQASFGTDRGPRKLPAWRLRIDGVDDPVFVLAVDPKLLWRAGSVEWTGADYRATLSGDGRSLASSYFGSPAGPAPCGAGYTADVTESRTAVVVTPRQIKPIPKGDSSQPACLTMAARRIVVVRLTAALGARVLLTPDGRAIPVTSG